jgi:acyl-CoA reductase-like NAD-dependent aldehyde dehydrogenase
VTVTRPRQLDMVIGGELVSALSGDRFDVVNPATLEVCASVPFGIEEDADRAVAAAARALPAWRATPATERGERITALARLLEARADEFAAAETAHNGKTLADARFDVDSTVACLDYYAGAANKSYGQTIPAHDGYLVYTLREPVGVCGLIVPWNFPLAIAVWKLGPALAAGNSVVIKPASETPLTALMLGQLAGQAGFPPGVVNVVTGPGSRAGQRLVTHPGVAKVSLTGETTTGQAIMRAAAATLKRVTLELGGKSPALVFADADLDLAVDGSLFQIFANAGQVCDARSRIFIQDAVYDEFVARFVARAGRLRVGDPTDPASHIGAITSAQQLEKIRKYVEIGEQEGAKLVSGGAGSVGPGLFHQPTVFADVDNSMRIAREEIFGPVACLGRFSDYDDGIAKANDTPYGLAATVWTASLSTAHRAAADIRAGGVWVNTSEFLFNEAPFGGMKASGYGRELSMHGLDAYTEVKNVGIRLAGPMPSFEL